MTFFGTYQVLKAERLLMSAGIPVEAVAAPRHISTECGICIRVNAGDEERVRTILKTASLEANGWYHEQ